MNSRFLPIALVFIALSASNAPAQDSRAAHAAEIEACKSRLASGAFRKRMDFAHCVNRVNRKWWGENNVDVLDYAASRELVAAQQFDAGRLTEVEYFSARAKIKTDLRSEIARRDAAATPTTVFVAPPAPRGPVNCYPIGRSFTCF